jgi:hypothetical protein
MQGVLTIICGKLRGRFRDHHSDADLASAACQWSQDVTSDMGFARMLQEIDAFSTEFPVKGGKADRSVTFPKA